MSILLGLYFGLLVALHDHFVFKRSGALVDNDVDEYTKWNRRWKSLKLFLVFSIGVCLYLFQIEKWTELVSFFSIFYPTFELSLNKFRGNRWFYISLNRISSRWDNIRRDVFGGNAEHVEVVIKLLSIVTGIVFYFL